MEGHNTIMNEKKKYQKTMKAILLGLKSLLSQKLIQFWNALYTLHLPYPRRVSTV